MDNNATANNGVYEMPEPNWGVLMFWEDFTYIFTLIGDFFKKLFGIV